MAAGATDVVIRFLSDVSDIKDGVNKIEGTTSKIKSWAKGAAAAIGTAFAVDQVKDWIGAASELQDQLSASQVVFGQAAKSVEQFANKAAGAFGMSKSEALDAANNFAAFGKGAGLAGDDLAGFSTGLVGLAGDLASFRGTTPEEAIQAVGAALRGETEPIRKYGVLLDDATLRQRALSMGLISTTKNALTPQQKVLAAQAELFAQTADAQGDFQRTGDSAANQQKKLSAEIANTQAALGTALLPVIQAILPVLSAFAAVIQENASWLVPLTAALGGLAIAIWLVNAALDANPIMQVALVVALLTAAIILLWKNWDTVWSAIVGAVRWATSFILDHWQMIVGFIFPFIGALMLLWNNWDTIWKWITGAISWAVGFIWGQIQRIIGFFADIPGAIQWALSTLGGIIVAPFQWAWDQIVRIKDDVVGVFDAVMRAGREAFNQIAGLWNNTVGSLSFSIPDWVPGIGGKGWDVPDIPTFARGGIVTGPTLALLGEAGREAVIPLDRMQSGGDVYITINTTGLGADAPSIQSAVVTALRQYTVRNGPLPAGIVG